MASKKVHATLAALEAEGKPEEFTYETRAGAIVTFPDIYDMPFEEGEQFLSDIENAQSTEVLQKWLSEEDAGALREEKLTFRQLQALIRMVVDHYQGVMGTPGEESASDR